jgi:transcriptional regulator with XRE-family HTH domain
MPVTSAQVRMARAALNWSVRDLAEAAQIHRNTVTNIETGRYAGDAATLAAIVGALRGAGVEFIDENGGGPGVRLRKRPPRKPKL